MNTTPDDPRDLIAEAREIGSDYKGWGCDGSASICDRRVALIDRLAALTTSQETSPMEALRRDAYPALYEPTPQEDKPCGVAHPFRDAVCVLPEGHEPGHMCETPTHHEGDARSPEFEVLEQELFKHQPVLSMEDGSIRGCQCLDRVFHRAAEDWGTHLAEVFESLSHTTSPDAATDLEDAKKLIDRMTASQEFFSLLAKVEAERYAATAALKEEAARGRDVLQRVWKAMGCAPNPDDFKSTVRGAMWDQIVSDCESHAANDTRIYRENQSLLAELTELKSQLTRGED